MASVQINDKNIVTISDDRSVAIMEIIRNDGSVISCKFDASDMPNVCAFRWHRLSGGYIGAYINGHATSMHRHLLCPPKEMQVDHENGDRPDNRRGNLRICTNHQNMCNTHKNAAGTSKYRGVMKVVGYEKWSAQISRNGRTFSLGRFNTEIDAAIAYDKEAICLHGEFAITNFGINNPRVKKQVKENLNTSISIRVGKREMDEIKQLAEKEGRTTSNMVVVLLKRQLIQETITKSKDNEGTKH